MPRPSRARDRTTPRPRPRSSPSRGRAARRSRSASSRTVAGQRSECTRTRRSPYRSRRPSPAPCAPHPGSDSRNAYGREFAVGGREPRRRHRARRAWVPRRNRRGRRSRSSRRPCPRRTSRGATRAIDPSSFDDSHEHAGGVEPGEAREVDGRLGVAGALEDAAGAGAEREDVPGGTRSCGARWVDGTWSVGARSAAEMPVVTPLRASIDTVNAVRGTRFVGHLAEAELVERSRDRRGRSHRSVWRIMKPIVSGVTICGRDDEVALVLAVDVVDDDNERPAPISSMACSIVANGLLSASWSRHDRSAARRRAYSAPRTWQ